MDVIESQLTVADYCAAFNRKEILVNQEYQRSSQVWPPAARSFLIETILLGYSIPKFFLHQKTDIRSRKSFKEIVDGQQRSKAIKDFFDDKLRLSPTIETPELVGLTYSELPDEYQERFLNYSLAVDLFVGATSQDIREIFRRMNSYTVPLNPEEKRHATFQGQFKWFIHSLSKNLDATLLTTGIFKEKSLIRMADTKLLSEISHAIIYGIQTTDARKLDALYRAFDDSFAREEELRNRFLEASDTLLGWTDLHGTPLMKPFSAYSLVLAITHILKPVPQLEEHFPAIGAGIGDETTVLANLSRLGDELEDPENAPDHLQEFIEASTTKTNVGKERATRFRWYCRALVDALDE
jgi:hypothetical protein